MPQARRVWQRHLGRRILEVHRPHQRVGAVDAGRETRAAVPAGEHAEQRFLRRQLVPAIISSANRWCASTPIRASASGISRWCITGCGITISPRPAGAGHHPSAGGTDRRGGAAHQAGLGVRVRPGDRQAGLAHRGAAGARERRAGRARVADAAVPHQASGVRAAGRDARRRVRPDAGAEGRGAGRDEEVPAGSDVHAAELAGNAHAARRDRRGELGRRRVRSGDRHALREVEQHAGQRAA